MRKTIMESPFDASNLKLHVEYARACIRKSLFDYNSAPLALHLLYNQKGIIDPKNPEEQKWLAEAKASWAQVAEAYMVYNGLGISEEMKNGIANAIIQELPIEFSDEINVSDIFNNAVLPAEFRTRAVIESPFKGATVSVTEMHVQYVQAAIRDALMKGYAPIASHLVYTQDGITDDDIPEEREIGIEGGVVWYEKAEVSLVYTDMGISDGMRYGVERAHKHSIPVKYMTLPNFKFNSSISNIDSSKRKSIVNPKFNGM